MPRITAFPRFRCDISLTLRPSSLSLPPFSPVSSGGSAWVCRQAGQRIRRTSCRRQARLFRKRICTFEKEGRRREPARWFDKENVVEGDGSTLPVIEQTAGYTERSPFLFLTHRRQPSTFPTVGDFCSRTFPLSCLLTDRKISGRRYSFPSLLSFFFFFYF